MKNQITHTNKILLATLALLLSVSVASAAWNAPTATPPGNNTLPPLNTGSQTQIKNGNLLIHGLDDVGAGYSTGLGVLNGNVGFGTVSPNNKLQLFSPGSVKTYAQFTNGTTGAGVDRGVIYGVDANGHGYFWNYEPLKDLYIGTNNLTRLFVSALGDIGIGTITPSAKLEVAGQVKITGGTPGVGKVLTSDANGLATWQTLPAATTTPQTKIIAGTGISVSPTSGVGDVTVNVTPPAFPALHTGSEAQIKDGSLLIRGLDATGAVRELGLGVLNGNVGIGTLAPFYKLSLIEGDLGFGTNGKGIRWGGISGWDWLINTEDTGAGNVPLYIKSNSAGTGLTTKVTVSSAGNVGIGTITPSAKLEVAGQVKITGGTPGVGKILVSDSTGLASWIATSSLGIVAGQSASPANTTILGPLAYVTDTDTEKTSTFSLESSADVLIISYANTCVITGSSVTMSVDGVDRDYQYYSGNDCDSNTLSAKLNLSAGNHTVRIYSSDSTTMFTSKSQYTGNPRPVSTYVYIFDGISGGTTASSFSNFRVFNASGTFVPSGVTKVMVELWGGGGGGAGGSSCQSGGGGGAYGKSIVTLTGGSPIVVTVGAGGSGGSASGTSSGGGNGSDGGSSSFGSYVTAGGGSGAGNPFGTAASGGTSNADISISGGVGQVAVQCAGSYGYFGANGGDAPNGGSGGFGSSVSDTRRDGIVPGGGGGGSLFTGTSSANSGGTGGNGAHGRVIVWY